MLPLAPSVIAQVAPWPHSTLQDAPQAPWQVASAPQANVQLSPHAWGEMLQDIAASQAQLVPVHWGGAFFADTSPQLAVPTNKRTVSAKERIELRVMMEWYRSFRESGS